MWVSNSFTVSCYYRMIMKLKTFTLVLFLCSSFLLSAEPIDSEASLTLVDQLYEKSKRLISTSLDSSHYYADKVSEMAKELGSKEYLAKSYFLQGYIYLLENKPAKGIKYLLRARLIYQELEDIVQEQRLLDNVVNIAIENQVFTIGEYYGCKRLEMLENIDDYRVRSDIYADMGYVYMNNDMLIRAMEYFSKSKLEMEQHSSLSDTVFYAKILTVLGVVNRRISEKVEQLHDSKQYHEAAIELYDHSLKVNASQINKVKIYNNTGYLSLKSGNGKEAMKYFEKAIQTTGVQSKRIYLPAINNIGQYYFGINQHDSAHAYFSQAIAINVKEGDHQANQFDRSISINLYSADELQKSLEYLEKISVLAPQLQLENPNLAYGFLSLQLERIQAIKQIEVNEMLEEVNTDIRKEVELANSQLTAVDWLIYIFGGLSFIAFCWMLFRFRKLLVANKQRRLHNEDVLNEIRKGSSKE